MPHPVTEPKTFQEYYDIGRAAALARSDRITTLSFTAGYMVDIFAGLPSALAEEVQQIAIGLNAKHYIQTAAAEDLDKLALDHFGLTRFVGVPAVGTVRFSRPDSLFGNVAIDLGTIVETGDGIQFVTTGAPLMVGNTVDVTVQAAIAGPDGVVEIGSIITINSATALPDTTITVSNLERTAGGVARETDADFRVRIAAWFKTLRRGTTLALQTGALFVGGIESATVDESIYPPTVYVADAAGGATSGILTLVKAELNNWRAAGIMVNVVGATVITQDVDISVVFAAGIDTSAATARIQSAVKKGINALGVGVTLYSSAIVGFVQSVSGVKSVVVNDPVGDVEPAVNELIRLGLLTFS